VSESRGSAPIDLRPEIGVLAEVKVTKRDACDQSTESVEQVGMRGDLIDHKWQVSQQVGEAAAVIRTQVHIPVLAQTVESARGGDIVGDDEISASGHWDISHGQPVRRRQVGGPFEVEAIGVIGPVDDDSAIGSAANAKPHRTIKAVRAQSVIGAIHVGGAADHNKDDDIYSTFWISGQKNAYTYLAGTSMAAPHVTGAIALLLAEGYSQPAAVTRLLDTADKGVGCEANSTTCRGRINVDYATAK